MASFLRIILKRKCITLLSAMYLFSSEVSFAQVTISGKIVNESNAPLPYVHIRVENTNIGTISNDSGQFKLMIDTDAGNIGIIISSVGYRTRKVFLTEGNHILSLTQEITELKEVVVAPIDYGKDLIVKAINAIPNNYPKIEENHKGFFREHTRWENGGKPIYVIEAEIESNKKPYSTKHLSGHVKLNELRKYKSDQLDSMKTRIYAGGHHIHRFDIVSRRSAFLGNPNGFDYTIEDTLRQDNKDIYKIFFQNRNGLSGHVYILDSSFAVIKADLNRRFFSKPTKDGRQYLNFSVTYEQNEDKIWRFKHSHYETAFKNGGQVLTLVSDYATTVVQSKRIEIPYSERFQFGDILLEEQKEYRPNFWDNYNIILPDTRSEHLFGSLKSLPETKSKDRYIKWGRVLRNLKYEMAFNLTSIEVQPFTIVSSNTGLGIPLNGTFSRKAGWGLSSSILYGIGSNFFVGYAYEGKLSKTGVGSHSLVISKSIDLNPKGRSLFISPELRLGFQELGFFLGSFVNADPFSVKGKSFDSDNIDIFLAQRNIHIQPNIVFGLEKSRRLVYSLSIGYALQFNERSGLFFLEKDGFFPSRKRTFLKNGKEGLLIEHGNGRLLKNNPSIKAGVIYRF